MLGLQFHWKVRKAVVHRRGSGEDRIPMTLGMDTGVERHVVTPQRRDVESLQFTLLTVDEVVPNSVVIRCVTFI